MIGMLATIVLLSAFMTLLVHGLCKVERGGFNRSVGVAVGMFAGVVIAGGAVIVGFGMRFEQLGGFFIAIGMTLYLPPLIRVSLHLRHALAESGVTLLYGWNQRGHVQRAKFGRAEYWMASKDFNGAVREYMRYFHADQGDPRPLLEAAHLLERQGNFQQSADMLREVIRYFQEDRALWARTAFQLARMLEQQLNDPKAAYKLYAQIVKQAPKTEAAQLAAARIMDPDRVE